MTPKVHRISHGIAATLALSLLAGCQIAPKQMTDLEIAAYSEDKLARVTQDQEPITGQITLYDAMARALKYNLDYKVEIMNRQLANKNLRLKSYAMLPKVVANGGWADRDNSAASYSQTLFAGVRSVDPTFSKEQGKFAGDVTFSWHILDFGLSYIRAQQAADEALIAEERKRKIINKIVEDVRTAYWRAVSADRLLEGFHKLRHRTERALAQSKRILKAGQTSPVSALTYQRELVDIKRQIHRLERELKTSKIQLAALMNVSPGSKYSLHIPKRRLTDLAIKASGDEMLRVALEKRPELREVGYQERINVKEAKAALLEILPGASVYAGLNLDTNDFLFNSNWVSYGAKVGWNLMKVFTYPARKGAVDAKQEVLDQRALATTMAIMTQVYVSRARYKYLYQSAQTAAEYYQVQRKLKAQIDASVRAGVASEQTRIREEMNTLVAAVQFDVAYADLQNAFAAVYAAVGSDPYDQNISTDMSVSELSAVLKKTWRDRGDSHL
ncbi:TolC family protein [Pseudahrensia aquimaris]|uniref:TolC family protein n=1 Tax=Pseudahrensia aquimaris TaxID=744461 RepID=A0ABW3FEP1_9HYPH